MIKFSKFYEQTQTRGYRFDRIPQKAQSIYDRESNYLLKQAITIAEGSHESISEDTPEFTEIADKPKRREARNKLSKLLKPKEEVDLYLWAKKNGKLIDGKDFDEQWIRDGKKGEAENEVYYDEDTHSWIKRNNLSYHSTYLEFFHRLALHNNLFPEAPVSLIGFTVKDNHLWPVISQPHIRADRGATREEVLNHMVNIGFENIPNTDDYVNHATGIKVEDLHDENVLMSPEGDMYIVDPVIYLTDEGKRGRLAAYTKI